MSFATYLSRRGLSCTSSRVIFSTIQKINVNPAGIPKKLFSTKSKNDLRWYKMLGELSDYRKEHGDSLVPMEYDINQKLGTWIDTQRQQYKYFKNKEKSSLTPERIELLEKEGMVWDVHDLNWNKKFQQLKEYQEKYGDCQPNPNEFSELNTWVQVQRRMHTLRMEGQSSSLTDDRLEKLESIGFVFKFHETLWNQRFKQLKDYRKNFGDCLIPKNYQDKVLAKWTDQQRSQYKYLQDGKRSNLTEERIKMLEDIDFVWNVHQYKWERRLKELEAFYEVNGHTNVPNKGNNKSLLTWVRRQKSEYQKFIAGEKSKMDEERAILLRKAGLDLDSA